MFSSILPLLPHGFYSSIEKQTSMARFDHARRLLLHSPLHKSPDPSAPYSSNRRFDSHIILILSVLLCVLVSSLVLNSIIRCALRCLLRAPLAAGEQISATPSAAAASTTGLKKKALEMFPTVSYSAELKLPGLASECAICLSEFVREETVRVLPKCNHGFHVKCIDKWLEYHSSCPTCRRCLIDTCKKLTEFHEPENTPSSEPVILPLEHEGFIRRAA